MSSGESVEGPLVLTYENAELAVDAARKVSGPVQSSFDVLSCSKTLAARPSLNVCPLMLSAESDNAVWVCPGEPR
eukprot:13527-Eustigmatos_ZCMA.PRE.1